MSDDIAVRGDDLLDWSDRFLPVEGLLPAEKALDGGRGLDDRQTVL